MTSRGEAGAPAVQSAGWSASALAVAALPLTPLVLVVCCWPGVTGLAATWESTVGMSHGWLLLAVSVVLLWRQRLAALPRWLVFRWAAAAALAALTALWIGARRAEVATLTQSLLPLILLAGYATVVERAALRKLAFPVLLMLFAVPVWFYLTEPLRWLTSAVVTSAVELTGITAYIHEHRIELEAGTLEIASGCSGLHQFVTGGIVGALYGYLYADGAREWAKAFLLALGISLVANWIRVYALVMIGHYSDMQHYFIRVDHYWFGWTLFALGMLAFYFIAGSLVRHRPRQGPGLPPPPGRAEAPTGLRQLASYAGMCLIMACALVAR